MIPPDVASRLRLIVPEQPAAPQPVMPARQLTDVLSNLIPGQRLMAEIQALLPNGTYRAVVGQRDVTLALPFSAKAGDSLELEVVESEGKLTLAFVTNRGDGKTAAVDTQSVPTSLSRTGQLIGDLLAGVGEDGKRAKPATLNGNMPLLTKMPANPADLVPILKNALASSGMFYEAHQARWVEGKVSTDALLQEPQGKLSPVIKEARGETSMPVSGGGKGEEATSKIPGSVQAAGATSENESTAASRTAAQTSGAPAVNQQVAPLVQQQLDALATQNYVWQGQVWPGQQMHWEISEDGSGRQPDSEDEAQRWQTSLILRLPGLGGIEARIRLLPGSAVDIALRTDREDSRQRLAAATGELGKQFDDAGLALAACTVSHEQDSA